MDSDNPPYLTITEVNDKFCVVLMEWNKHEEEYKLVKCIPYTSRSQALQAMIGWAHNDGLEVR